MCFKKCRSALRGFTLAAVGGLQARLATMVAEAAPAAVPSAPPAPLDAAAMAALAAVPVTLTVQVGSRSLTLGELYRLGQGAVVELEASLGTPVDVLVNNTLFARGELRVQADRAGIGVVLTEMVGSGGAVAGASAG